MAQNACVYVTDFLDHFPGNVLIEVLEKEESSSTVGFPGSTQCYLLISFLADIQLRTPARRKLLVAKQYLVHFSVDDTSRSTKHAKEKNNCTSWDEIFYLWVMCIP